MFRFITIREEFAFVTLYRIRIKLQFIDNVIVYCIALSLLLLSIFILITCVRLSCFKSKINIRTKLAFANLYCIVVELLFVKNVFIYCFKIALLLSNILVLIIFVNLYRLKSSRAKLAFAN